MRHGSFWLDSRDLAFGAAAAGAEAALFAGLNSGRAYFNIHTSAFPGGEIRGFLAVPEPNSVAPAGLALLLLVGMRQALRRSASA